MAASVPAVVQVPPLLIRRLLQLIETYETQPGVTFAVQTEPAELPIEISADVCAASQPSGTPQPDESIVESVEQVGGSEAGAADTATASAGAMATPAASEVAAAEPDRAELLRELEITRSELAELSQLMEELPTIFERKFRQRLEPILQEQYRLQADNTRLRQQLEALPGNDRGRPLLVPSLAEGGSAAPRRRARGLGRMLQRALGFSDRDDGRTKAA